MAEIFDFFAISRMLEKQWHPPQTDCLFFSTCDNCDLATPVITNVIDLFSKRIYNNALCDYTDDIDNEEFVEPRRGSTKQYIIQLLSFFNRTMCL